MEGASSGGHWITLKALEKDPARRYQSPADLAADIERHLADEPVAAGPPSRSYRGRKFVMRHRFGVATALAAVLFGLASLLAVSLALVRAREAEARSRDEAERATAMRDVLLDTFRTADPDVAREKGLTAVEVLDRGAERVVDGLEQEPRVRVTALMTIAESYFNLGQAQGAEELLAEAQKMTEGELGTDSRELPWVLRHRARALQARDRLDEALGAAERSLELLLDSVGPDDPETGLAFLGLAIVLDRLGRLDEAAEGFESCASILRPRYPEGVRSLADCVRGAGWVAQRLGRFDDSEKAYNPGCACRNRNR